MSDYGYGKKAYVCGSHMYVDLQKYTEYSMLSVHLV